MYVRDDISLTFAKNLHGCIIWAHKHKDKWKTSLVICNGQQRQIYPSEHSFVAATLYEGYAIRKHKLWNIVSMLLE